LSARAPNVLTFEPRITVSGPQRGSHQLFGSVNCQFLISSVLVALELMSIVQFEKQLNTWNWFH